VAQCLWIRFTGKYNKWDKVDPAELFSQAPTEKKEANPKLNMVKFLQVREHLQAHRGAHLIKKTNKNQKTGNV
jgi:hypothetical protein